MISEGAVLQETSRPDSNGLVTKKFNAKSGVGNMDRVAFYLNLKNDNFKGETIGTHGSPLQNFGACKENDCAKNRSSWRTIRAPTTAGCGGEIEFTDGEGLELPSDVVETGGDDFSWFKGKSEALALVSGLSLLISSLITN